MTRLAVIILNWNGIELLKQFLPTASKFTRGEGIRLVVADNGSTDGSVAWIRENHPEVDVLEFEENLGFAGGYNRALKETGAEYTILLNSDVEVTEGWWQPLLQYMEQNSDTGALQPKIKSYRNKKMFEYAGAAGGYLNFLGFPYCRGRNFFKVEEDKGQYDGVPAEIHWASGACLMVRNSDYFKAGALDESFFAHMEEIDLCWRIRRMGKKVTCITDVEVYHVGGASLPKENPKKTYLNFRNNLLLLHKNLPEEKRGVILFFRRLVDTAAMGFFLLKGEPDNVKAVWKAHMDFRKLKTKS